MRRHLGFASVVRAASLAAALLGGVLGAQAQAAPINLVQNGDFTQTTLTGAGGYVCGAGSTATTCSSVLTAWSATCGPACNNSDTPTSVLFRGSNGSAWNGGTGLYSAKDSPLGGNILADDGDPLYASTLSQTVKNLTKGNTYTLTFYQAAAQQKGLTGDTTEKWRVTFGGATQDSTLMSNKSQGFVDWNQQTMTFVASAASQVLTFLSIGTPNGLPPVSLLSSVSLLDTTPVPEPASAALFGAGLLGLLLARQRAAGRRQAAARL